MWAPNTVEATAFIKTRQRKYKDKTNETVRVFESVALIKTIDWPGISPGEY